MILTGSLVLGINVFRKVVVLDLWRDWHWIAMKMQFLSLWGSENLIINTFPIKCIDLFYAYQCLKFKDKKFLSFTFVVTKAPKHWMFWGHVDLQKKSAVVVVIIVKITISQKMKKHKKGNKLCDHKHEIKLGFGNNQWRAAKQHFLLWPCWHQDTWHVLLLS